MEKEKKEHAKVRRRRKETCKGKKKEKKETYKGKSWRTFMAHGKWHAIRNIIRIGKEP
jgi:hypothetical protein